MHNLQTVNKAFIDIRHRPGVATPLAAHSPLRPTVTSSIKPEVHNISKCRHRRTEPRPPGICIKNCVKIGSAVLEICSRTDRQTHTHRQTDRNTPLPYRGGVEMCRTVSMRSVDALYTVFQKKTSTHTVAYKLRNSCLILIIFDTKIPDIS